MASSDLLAWGAPNQREGWVARLEGSGAGDMHLAHGQEAVTSDLAPGFCGFRRFLYVASLLLRLLQQNLHSAVQAPGQQLLQASPDGVASAMSCFFFFEIRF
jgi:hypothetical protein